LDEAHIEALSAEQKFTVLLCSKTLTRDAATLVFEFAAKRVWRDRALGREWRLEACSANRGDGIASALAWLSTSAAAQPGTNTGGMDEMD
jgi:hypothetical protein